MFRSFQQGLKLGGSIAVLEQWIRDEGFTLVYYPSTEAERLARRYKEVQETIEDIASDRLFGTTIVELQLVIIHRDRTAPPLVMTYQLHHELAHVLTAKHDPHPPKLGHTTEFFQAERGICERLRLKQFEGPDNYDENGDYIERSNGERVKHWGESIDV